jgi:dihydroorotase
MKILIKQGRIIDPSQKFDGVFDLLINNDKIVELKKNITAKAAQKIDAKNKIIAPGLIDLHTHLREPGEEHKETIATGVKAAIAGGFTTVCAMPNTKPACDNQAQVEFILARAKAAKFNVLPIATITKERVGKEISPMAELKKAGSIAVSDDGDAVADSRLLRRAMEYAAMLNLLVICHCEDKILVNNGVMHEGYWSTVLGLRPIPTESESIIVARDIQLAELTGARIHIAHVSTAKSVEIIRQAKKRGVKVTAEATPHHFTLTDEAVKIYNTNAKVNPPLRSKEDVKAIIKALHDGTIDVIATDHAPHADFEKEKEFDYAPFGLTGLETALPLAKRILDWPELIAKMSYIPSQILNYNRGTLKPGSIADLIIIDPNKKWIYSEDQIKSKAKNSPFLNWELTAQVEQVYIAGKLCKL